MEYINQLITAREQNWRLPGGLPSLRRLLSNGFQPRSADRTVGRLEINLEL